MSNSINKICKYFEFEFPQSNLSSSEFNKFESLYQESSTKECFLDMKNVDKIDNSFIADFIRFAKSNVEVHVYNINSDLLALFFLINIDSYVNIFDSKKNAVMNQTPLVRRRFSLV